MIIVVNTMYGIETFILQNEKLSLVHQTKYDSSGQWKQRICIFFVQNRNYKIRIHTYTTVHYAEANPDRTYSIANP